MPFISIRHPDFECDDVIATYVYKHAQKGDQCFVVSSDSDFIQLHNVCDVVLSAMGVEGLRCQILYSSRGTENVNLEVR